MKISEVFKICEAYESGFGHGFKKDGLKNPYKDKNLGEAYKYGYNVGEDLKNRHEYSVKEENNEIGNS